MSYDGHPREGELLGGRFLVERVLGAGGMGSVVAAYDQSTGQRVAVKCMLPHLAGDPELIDRFMREARAASTLPGDHIARVFEAGRLPDGSPYMVMELLAGADLNAVLKKRGPLPIPEAVLYVLETCRAIASAHQHGYVHRDLKPANLFLADQGQLPPIIKVLDFGISKATSLGDAATGATAGLTATDSTLGSPHYMSPEQLKSPKHVDRRSDIWSLGVILMKLTTGGFPFNAETVGAYLMMVASDKPSLLRERLPDAPKGLEAAIDRCLQRDQARRFQNVGQLALALAPFAPPGSRAIVDMIVDTVGHEASEAKLLELEDSSGGTLVASTVASDEAATPVARRRGGRGWVLGLGAALAGVAGIFFLVRSVRPLEAATPPPREAPPPAQAARLPGPLETSLATVEPAPPPADIEVRLELTPPDAMVELDGVVVPDRPLRFVRAEATHRIVVRAKGFAPETREFSARESTALVIALHPLGARTGAPPSPPPATPPPPRPPRTTGPLESTL